MPVLVLLWHKNANASPEVASVSSSAFPCISVDFREIVLEAAPDVESCVRAAVRDIFRYLSTASLIEIDLIWCVDIEFGPVSGGICALDFEAEHISKLLVIHTLSTVESAKDPLG